MRRARPSEEFLRFKLFFVAASNIFCWNCFHRAPCKPFISLCCLKKSLLIFERLMFSTSRRLPVISNTVVSRSRHPVAAGRKRVLSLVVPSERDASETSARRERRLARRLIDERALDSPRTEHTAASKKPRKLQSSLAFSQG